jgi:rhamnogalacturonan acetylesterase
MNKLLFLACLLFFSFIIIKKEKPTIYIIGDSTVKNGGGKGSDGLWGWGSFIHEHFDTTKINIENHAIGGRSSRTFLTDGRWDTIKAKLKKGDFVLMQFGHNDGGAINDSTRARGTIKGLGEASIEIDNILTKKTETVHTYGWYMHKYILEAQQKGAKAIVFSPVPRNVWKDGKIPKDNYGIWAKEIAYESGAFFVDLNEMVIQIYEQSSEEKLIKDFFPKDHTHTNYEGAKLNAATVVEGIKGLRKCKIQQYLALKP